MNIALITCGTLAVLCAAAGPILYRRRVRDVDTITRSFHKDPLKDLVPYLCFIGSSPKDDADFYRRLCGMQGIGKIRKNTQLLVELLQALVHQRIVPEEDLKYIAPLAMSVHWYCVLATLDALLRWIVPTLPHASARLAASIYGDLEAAVRAIFGEHYPSGLTLLDAVL